MERRIQGFAQVIFIALLAVLGGIGLFAYTNFQGSSQKDTIVSSPTCQINCPTPYPTGSIPGWLKYEESDKSFSFEYPQTWFYANESYKVPSSDIYISSGLYPISKDKLEEQELQRAAGKNVDWSGFLLYKVDYPAEASKYGYEIVSRNHYYFEQTDVVAIKYCLPEGIFYKGHALKAREICDNQSYIDLGNNGHIVVENVPFNNVRESMDEVKIYEKILSTIKINP